MTIDGQEGPGQLQRALNFRRNGDILIETRGRELVSYGQTFLENQEFEFPFSPQFNLEYYRSLFSLQIDVDYFSIVGSCNGLLCLRDNHFCDNMRINLWNPSIRLLHHWFRTGEYRYKIVHRIGFDSRNNDYKVVMIVFVRKERQGLPVNSTKE